MPDYEDYYRSQGLVPNADGTEWVRPSVDALPVEGYDPAPAERAALRLGRAGKRENPLPVADDRGHPFGPLNPEAPSYLIEPDLQEAQGGIQLPNNMYSVDNGQVYFKDTNQPVPIARRPGLLPVTMTPEGTKVVMPKMLDLIGNVMGNVGGKVVAKPGEMVLGSGLVRPTMEAVKETGPFYSQLERTVENAKINLATPEQWLGYLKNQPGVKSEEINHVLGNLPTEGMLSKEQLSEIVKANKVELKEKILGAGVTQKQLDDEAMAAYGKKYNDLDRDHRMEVEDKFEAFRKAPTQYHQYQLPGGENYKETLLHLPGRSEKVKTIEDSMNANNRSIKALRDEMHGTSGTDEIRKEIRRLQDENDVLNIQRKEANSNIYVAPHFDGDNKNLIGHARSSERTLPNDEGWQVYNRFSDKTSDVFKTKAEAEAFVKNTDDPGAYSYIPPKPLKGKHIEELQSDWAQNIRDKGFKGEKEKLQPEFDKVEAKLMATNDDKLLGLPTVKDVLAKAVEDKILTKQEAATYKRFTDIEHQTPVPDMPFKKNWDEVLIKKEIHDAVMKGHKFITVTPGEAQALRYQNDVRQKIDNIRWIPREGKAGERVVSIKPTSGNTNIYLDVDKTGTITSGHGDLKGKKLDEVIGKDLSRQIFEKGEGNIDTKGYVMGAEGMKGYYDKMVVDKFNNIGKKYGAKMEPFGRELPKTDKYTIKRTGDIHDEERGASVFHVYKNDSVYKTFKSRKEAEEHIVSAIASTKGQPVHYFPITPELEKKAKEGFELFSTANPTLIPVDKPPEFEDNKKFKLIPVTVPPVF